MIYKTVVFVLWIWIILGITTVLCGRDEPTNLSQHPLYQGYEFRLTVRSVNEDGRFELRIDRSDGHSRVENPMWFCPLLWSRTDTYAVVVGSDGDTTTGLHRFIVAEPDPLELVHLRRGGFIGVTGTLTDFLGEEQPKNSKEVYFVFSNWTTRRLIAKSDNDSILSIPFREIFIDSLISNTVPLYQH